MKDAVCLFVADDDDDDDSIYSMASLLPSAFAVQLFGRLSNRIIEISAKTFRCTQLSNNAIRELAVNVFYNTSRTTVKLLMTTFIRQKCQTRISLDREEDRCTMYKHIQGKKHELLTLIHAGSPLNAGGYLP